MNDRTAWDLAMSDQVPAPDVDLAGVHDLAGEVDATRRLVGVADELIQEILGRYRRIVGRMRELMAENPETDSGATMDSVMDLSHEIDLRRELLVVADRICVELDENPPSVAMDV